MTYLKKFIIAEIFSIVTGTALLVLFCIPAFGVTLLGPVLGSYLFLVTLPILLASGMYAINIAPHAALEILNKKEKAAAAKEEKDD